MGSRTTSVCTRPSFSARQFHLSDDMYEIHLVSNTNTNTVEVQITATIPLSVQVFYLNHRFLLSEEGHLKLKSIDISVKQTVCPDKGRGVV